MSCFCKSAAGSFALALPSLEASASLSMNATAQAVLALDARLGGGVPGVPSGWLSLPMPQVGLSFGAVAGIAAAAQLRAQAAARCGIDLSSPLGIAAMTRLAATLDARLSGMAGLDVNMQAWMQLALLDGAIGRIQAAIAAGAFASASASAGLCVVVTPPGWGGFVANLQSLSLLLGASAQLGVSLGATAQFNAALRATAAMAASLGAGFSGIGTASLAAMCRLSAGLSAVAQLGRSLGLNPLQAGLPAVQARVSANFAALASAMAAVGVSLPGLPGLTLPQLPGLPSFCSSATVRAAAALGASADLDFDFEVSASMSAALACGLSVTALAANLSAALGISASLSPCAACDSRAVVASLGAVVSA